MKNSTYNLRTIISAYVYYLLIWGSISIGKANLAYGQLCENDSIPITNTWNRLQFRNSNSGECYQSEIGIFLGDTAKVVNEMGSAKINFYLTSPLGTAADISLNLENSWANQDGKLEGFISISEDRHIVTVHLNRPPCEFVSGFGELLVLHFMCIPETFNNQTLALDGGGLILSQLLEGKRRNSSRYDTPETLKLIEGLQSTDNYWIVQFGWKSCRRVALYDLHGNPIFQSERDTNSPVWIPKYRLNSGIYLLRGESLLGEQKFAKVILIK